MSNQETFSSRLGMMLAMLGMASGHGQHLALPAHRREKRRW